MIRFNQLFARQGWMIFVFLLASFLLIGCAPDIVSAATINSKACEMTDTIKANIYTGDANYKEMQTVKTVDVATQIYAVAPQNLGIARREALKFLEYETERWSDVQYINIKDKPNMRIVVTFLSPGLIRAIVLNALISDSSLYDPANPADLDKVTNDSFETMGIKNDFAFLMLIQTEPDSSSTPRTFSIAPQDMTLHNTYTKQTARTRTDDFLNLKLNFSEAGYSGIIFYPVAAQDGIEACATFLNQDSETSLTLMTEAARIDDVPNQTLFWNFVFPLLADLNQPLLKLDLVHNSPPDAPQPAAFPAKTQPVVTSYNPSENIDWLTMGRFIWWKLTLDHIPAQ